MTARPRRNAARLGARLRLGSGELQPVARREGAAVVVEFLVDGRPLSGSPWWSAANRLVVPGVVACLQSLPRRSEVLVLALQGTPHHPTRIGNRTVDLAAQDVVYLEHVRDRRFPDVAWIVADSEDRTVSELMVRPSGTELARAVDMGWDWHSFRGYTITRSRLPDLLEWLMRLHALRPAARRTTERAAASIVFEDWADACALRLWSTRLSAPALAARVDLAQVNRALARVPLGRAPRVGTSRTRRGSRERAR